MKIIPKNVKFLQEGGQMPLDAPMEGTPTEEAPMEEAPMLEAPNLGQDPIILIVLMAAQAIQSQNCDLAMLVCQALILLVLQAQGGAPAAPLGEPVFRRGGKLAYRIIK